jgi:hypothetical protein
MNSRKLELLLSMIMILITSCQKNENSPTNTIKCKLTESATSGQFDINGTDPGTYTQSQKLEYNDKNLISGRSTQQANKTKSNKTYMYSTSESFQYNADGFLVKQISQGSTKDYSNINSTYSSSITYEYTNSRLTKEARATSSFDGTKTVTSTINITYEYNTDGKVTKYAYTSSSSDGGTSSYLSTYEYTNGLLSKLSYTSGGVITTPLIEVNSQGFITKQVDGARELRYQYDADGNTLKTETWKNGKKTEARVYEYDDKQNVNLTSYAPFKGHPDLNFYGNDYLAAHNIIKDERLIVDGAGVEKPYGSTVYTFQYNSNNLPTSSSTSYTGSDGKISQQSSVSYTYKDCQ